jgi:phospholipid-translocating ATPase
MWADTVLASQGFVIGLVVYTGRQTRSQMNCKSPTSKMSLLDHEVNTLSKILFVFLIVVAAGICFLNGFHGDWKMFLFRTILLLSSIIPISLRVNLDLAKLWYSYCINNDEGI